MASRRPALPSWVEGLQRAGLLDDPILVLGDADLARRLARHGHRVQAQLPGRRSPPAFATVVDLGWTAARPPARQRAALRDLADVALHGGALHVHVARTAAALQAPGRPWHLLTLHEVDGAWVATFVHSGELVAPWRHKAVRAFSDLGAFGSLDLDAATDGSPGSRPPG